MCGIAGFLDPAATFDRERSLGTVEAMARALEHRGPDGGDSWLDVEAGIALGHRRLAVIDPSEDGRQPMISASGRYVVVYNGETYNFPQLRRELEGDGSRFRGHSDTEVLLAGVERWGVVGTLVRANGMLAWAVWDRQRRELWLARDRLGKKPLYVGRAGSALVFASEPGALRAHPQFEGSIERDALCGLLRFGYVPTPHSIYREVRKLPAGSVLRIAADRLPSTIELVERAEPYWTAAAAIGRARSTPFVGSEQDAADAVERAIGDAVESRLVSDVPLGAFLSGGIDSSLVVAAMQARSARPVRTFTIGFDDPVYNEAPQAAAVAAHLGTEHHELYVSAEQAMAAVRRMPALFSEPFADSSQVPMFLVSQAARREVTVALSGDGGDELFAGYNRHVWGPRLWNRAGRLPRAARRAAGRSITLLSPQRWNQVAGLLDPALPRSLRHRMPGYKLHKLARALGADTPAALYRDLTSQWTAPSRVVLGGAEPTTVLDRLTDDTTFDSFVDQMLYLDLVTYLHDDILVKVDRASMGVGLEARAPLLDPALLELAWSLPIEMKIRDDRGKWILREVLERSVPSSLWERPKAGFGLPIDRWLRGPLRDWAEALLDERRLRDDGLFDPRPIREVWDSHLSGTRDRQYELWSVLMFQGWLHQS